MTSCQVCGDEFRLNVVSDRHTGIKYLRAGCCDYPLRPAPKINELLRSPNLSNDDRSYLQRVSQLDWFGAQVASVLLQIEAKVKAAGEVAA
jgi:hypothetical protein